MAKKKKSSTIEKKIFNELKDRTPKSIEAEKQVLGAMFLDESAPPKAFEILKPEHFFDSKHIKIFDAMFDLFEDGEPINIMSVYNELEKRGQLEKAGGAEYLSELTQSVVSAVNIAYNARIVLEKWILRKIISSSIEMADEALTAEKDVFDILDEAERNIFSIAQEGLRESYTPMDKAVKDTLEYIDSIHGKKNNENLIETNLVEFDALLGGLQKSDLIIIAARPSMGKTAFALTIARNIAVEKKVPIAFFSLEMSTLQLVMRLISSEAKIDLHKLRTGRFPAEDGKKLGNAASRLKNAPLFIDDTPAQTVMEIRAKARRMKSEHKIGLIIIDYLQLMTSSKKMESREREISMISSSLKALAKELDIPVIALAQLNRAVEQRADKRPMLSDLRESGSIEQDADVVVFLYRPEFYGITSLKEKDGMSTDGYAEAIIGKQRNGPTGVVPLHYIKQFGRFENRVINVDGLPEGIAPKSLQENASDNDVPF